MKISKKLLIIGSMGILPVSIMSTISCVNNIADYKWKSTDQYGKPVPLYAKDLHKYLIFEPILESINSISASTAVKLLNNADIDMKMNALKSFAKLQNDYLPTDFEYSLVAKEDHKSSNSIVVEINVREKKNGSKDTILLNLDGFKNETRLDLEQQKIINNNILEVNGLKYLIDDIDLSKLSTVELKNRTNAYSWSKKMVDKYKTKKFSKNPLANFFYSSTFDNGIKKVELTNNIVTKSFMTIVNNDSNVLDNITKAENVDKKDIDNIINFIKSEDTKIKLESNYKDTEKVNQSIQDIIKNIYNSPIKKDAKTSFIKTFLNVVLINHFKELSDFINKNLNSKTLDTKLSEMLKEVKKDLETLSSASQLNNLENYKKLFDKIHQLYKLSLEATNKENALNIQNAEFNAIEGANDLIYKKETQVVKNSETDVIVDPGYSDAPKVRTVIQKLLYISQAYLINEKNNSLYKNEELKNIISEIMDDFATKYFFAGQQQFVNWWFYEIGIPRDLTKLLGVLNKVFENEFTSSDEKVKKGIEEKFEHWSAGINYFLPNARYGGAAKTAIINYVPVTKKRVQTGANVIDTAKPIIATGILNKNVFQIEDALMAMYDNLFREFVKNKDGFYRDGSFIQHDNLPYAGSYGEVLYTGIADIFKYFENSKFDLSKDKRFERIYKFTELAVMPYMFKMSISDGLSGRSIVRLGHGDKQKGMNILGALTIIAKNAPELYKARLVNFIIDQVSSFTETDLKSFAKTYKIRDLYLNNLIDYLKMNKLPELARDKEDWEFYESTYFNTFNEPSTITNSLNNKSNTPVGIDLAEYNNGLVFSKNQDRYVWKNKDFMFNINLHGRTVGFPEATLGENLESYYYSDGATLLHTSKNNNPYKNEYWTVINPELIPGTSSLHTSQFNKIYSYNFPDNLGPDTTKWNNPDLEKAYDDFINALRDKQKKIEDNLSLSTNKSFNNGIIFDGTGFVKAMVQNWNGGLITRKAYFMIDNQIITVGNVYYGNESGKIVTTTIENRLQENEKSAKFSETNINKKKTFLYSDSVTNEKNAYVILENNATHKLNHESKYPIIANFNRNLTKEKNKISRYYNTLSFDHTDNNKFSYSTIPNYDEANNKEYSQLLSNFKILVNNHDYIVASYKKIIDGKEVTNYYIASFVEENLSKKRKDLYGNYVGDDVEYQEKVKKGLFIPGLDTTIYLYDPTTLVIQKNDFTKKWKVITSSDTNKKNYEIYFDKDFINLENKEITNNKIDYTNQTNTEVKMFKKNNSQTGFGIFNGFALSNDIKHNTWFIIEEKSTNEK
ncbi:polysaccharide lyase family 8 super-sandwich domain-containing protein [Mycoplasma crocodyli]|uniref:Broad-specificity glycosaminoglycan lyase (Family 8 polysaccharide lyase) n=1 Tax=Mycoplasma crocodyli (strain ATCC 51981 / MP145) TaxID=512564 RepID=D5E5I1_MYCCM|nr:polysaccharide lyase family 8 super-sandwich domain-containing protein [Mycoplasma crocodyli]ADE19838.1 broad-specificity glycosaminoglycan lyase (family 8 polysaccharide lyase) [Mycoplasma crocodyli MP145]